MNGTSTLEENGSADLMKTVRSSLDTIRNLLQEGTGSEEIRGQILQLEQLEQVLLDQAARLDAINAVLEEFNYSVAHELFAPLRRISGFTQEIKRRCAEELDPEGIRTLDCILDSTRRMNELIDALMQLSRLSHVELQKGAVDLSQMAEEITRELSLAAPKRRVVSSIQPQLQATADAALVQIALRKLIENAWKYTAQTETALIEFGAVERESGRVFYLRDNGVGFDMAQYGRLFHPFQRLHDEALFPGNGIGLTAVKRIVERHGGQVWAEGARDQGATFFFTL